MYSPAVSELNRNIPASYPFSKKKPKQKIPRNSVKPDVYWIVFASCLSLLLPSDSATSDTKSTDKEFVSADGNAISGNAMPVNIPNITRASSFVAPPLQSASGKITASMLCKKFVESLFSVSGIACFNRLLKILLIFQTFFSLLFFFIFKCVTKNAVTDISADAASPINSPQTTTDIFSDLLTSILFCAIILNIKYTPATLIICSNNWLNDGTAVFFNP